MGELQILQTLLSGSCLEPMTILSAWMGPSGAPQDFQFPSHCIEVKATGEAYPRSVRISSEFQLDTAKSPITLAVCHLPATDDPVRGLSLNQAVRRISATLSPEARQVFDTRLALARYMDIPEYDAPAFEHASTDCFEIRDDFPCLAQTDLPQGISRVRYELDIAELSEYRISGMPEVAE